MKLLLIGGTRFAGRWTTALALRRGHEVTLFHRGRTGADLFPEAEHVLGDRETDLDHLAGRRFDAVIDFCGYVPRVVRAAAERLADSGSYTFVSSISAYADGLPVGATEDAPLHPPPWPDTEEVTGETHGPLKVACEAVVREVFGERAIVVRPGFIVGPHDPTDRFTSLVRRAAAGGEQLVPAPADAPLQFVDARDLAAFLVHLAERGAGGAYNAIHPMGTTTIGEVVGLARGDAGTTFTWVDPDWLVEALGEERYTAFPLWAPESPAFHQLDGRRAAAAGLPTRPVADTVRDTLAWDRALAPRPPQELGLAPERERELLERWRQRG